MSYLQGLPAFAGYFGMGVGFVALFVTLWIRMTPHRELTLIRGGNVAAALTLSGALLGYCLPLASALAHSVSHADLAVWGLVALVAQLVAYVLTRLLLPKFPGRIEANDLAAAFLSAALQVGVGLLNAAAMVY